MQVTPELIVRKRTRTSDSEEEEEDQDQGPKKSKQQKMDSLQNQMTKMLEGMADLKRSVATKEDMKGVNNRLKAIEST